MGKCVRAALAKGASPGGLEPPTFRLTAERANQLRHGDLVLSPTARILLIPPFPSLLCGGFEH